MKAIKKFLKYVKPYVWSFVFATFGGLIKFLIPLIFPSVLAYLIDKVFSPESSLSVGEKLRTLNLSLGGMIGIYALIWIPGTYIRSYFSGKAGQTVMFNVRYDLFQHIQKMSASYFSRNQSGGIVSRLINDIGLAQNLLGAALTNVWMDSALLIVLLGILLKMNVPMTLVALSIMPFYIIFTKIVSRKIKLNSRLIQDEIESISGNLQERMAGYTVVKAFGAEKYEQERFAHQAKRLLKHAIAGIKLNAFSQVSIGFITSVAPMIVVWFAGYHIIQSRLTVGQLVAFYAYLQQFYFPLNRFAELSTVLSNSLAALERIFEVFEIEPDVQEKEHALCLQNINGTVAFHNVSFSYHVTPVLKNINLTINAGEKVAIVGSSGAGKSTITNLIPRFYDVTEGYITIDQTDIKDVTIKSLRANIGMVLQDSILFSGTLKENIRYGDQTATEAEVFRAAQAARVDEFVQEFPDGFDTEVGERGAKLSGGQKQRIAIARAFLKNPKILILDEATSALDSESENQIQEALDDLMQGRTTVIIAHRLSTIMNADKIVVLNKGEIAEIGTHNELIARNGVYKRLYDEQFKEIPD